MEPQRHSEHGGGAIVVRGPTARIAQGLDLSAQTLLWVIGFFVMSVVPWFFGGMGPEGYWFTVWAGWACCLPLILGLAARVLRREVFGSGFWVALVCWGLLAVQIFVSVQNRSQTPQAPWVGVGFDSVKYNPALPSSAFSGSTHALGRLYLSYGVFALTAYVVGFRRKALTALLWVFGANVAVLAAIGIPFKYSGNYRMLGRWEMDQNYFFSTFTYHNQWCAFALLGLAAVVGLFWITRNLALRLLLCLFAGIIAVSAPISVSRSGTAMMLVFGSIVFGVWLRRVLRGHKVRAGLSVILLVLLVAGALGATAIYLNTKGPGSVGQRNWSYILKQKNPFASRIMLVQDAIPMVKEKPLTGWGLGAFGAGFRKFQRPETIIVYNQGRSTLYDHCHNDWMERLVELGFVGMGLFSAPVLFWWIRRVWRHRGLCDATTLRFWLLCGLCCVWFFALGDIAFDNRSVAAIVSLLAGVVFGDHRDVSKI